MDTKQARKQLCQACAEDALLSRVCADGYTHVCAEYNRYSQHISCSHLLLFVQDWSVVRNFPDMPKKGVLSVKLGPDAKTLLVGAADHNLRVFGMPAQ